MKTNKEQTPAGKTRQGPLIASAEIVPQPTSFAYGVNQRMQGQNPQPNPLAAAAGTGGRSGEQFTVFSASPVDNIVYYCYNNSNSQSLYLKKYKERRYTMNAKRILCALLAVMLSLGVLVSCASGSKTETPSTTAAVGNATEAADTTADTQPVETGRESVKDAIPEGLRFDGETVNIVYRNEIWYETWDTIGTDNSGDMIQDAIWQRNINVEERFGVTLNLQPTQTTGLSNVGAEIKQMVMAGSDEFDMIVSTGNSTVTQGIYPYVYELSNLKYLNIDQPWWRDNAIRALSFDGQHYRFLMGDNTLNDYLKCGIMVYNKDLYNDIFGDPDEPYKLVLEGTWTWDKVMEMCEAAYNDANGDGQLNRGDIFGMMWTGNDIMTHIVMSCNPDLFVYTEAGVPDLSVFNSERNVEIIEKLIQVFHGTSGVWLADVSVDNVYKYFAQNESLMYGGRMSNLVSAEMREMESDYGVLPLPKFNSDQKEYVTNIQSSATITCLPKTVPASRIDMVDAVLEGWAAEAYRVVLTPFIETALKLKYSRDALSGQVIDIVFDTAGLNFLEMYSDPTGGIFSTGLVNQVTNGKQNFASIVKKLLPAAQKQLDSYIEKNVLSGD